MEWWARRPDLDHDVRALLNAHDRGLVLLLLILGLTKGKGREMSRCEEDRADFKRKLHRLARSLSA